MSSTSVINVETPKRGLSFHDGTRHEQEEMSMFASTQFHQNVIKLWCPVPKSRTKTYTVREIDLTRKEEKWTNHFRTTKKFWVEYAKRNVGTVGVSSTGEEAYTGNMDKDRILNNGGDVGIKIQRQFMTTRYHTPMLTPETSVWKTRLRNYRGVNGRHTHWSKDIAPIIITDLDLNNLNGLYPRSSVKSNVVLESFISHSSVVTKKEHSILEDFTSHCPSFGKHKGKGTEYYPRQGLRTVY